MVARREAMWTPSPQMSSGSVVTSPRLTPIRYSIEGFLDRDWLRSTMLCWITVLHRAASTGLSKIATNPSAVVLTSVPWCSRMLGSMSSRSIRSIRRRTPSSLLRVGRPQPEISPATTAARRSGTDCGGMPFPFDLNSRISPMVYSLQMFRTMRWRRRGGELRGVRRHGLRWILTNLSAPLSAPVAILEHFLSGDRAS
jgi:hypothetical protein